ncbi:MAG: YfhO family protein [Candidatus Limivicinus sp.]|jgi:uncharacterized membrane protein YfhO
MYNTERIEKRNSPRKIKTFALLISAFAVPFVMFLGVCAILHMTPFGSKSILSTDMINQYIPYFSYYKGVFEGRTDCFYTFSKTLGGDTAGIWAYYLMSPFNIILGLVPRSSFPLAITFIMAAKIGLCGLTSSIFLINTGKRSFSALIFSMAYALMSYNMAYLSNIMWLDAIYLLPVVVLGIEKILKGRKILTYVLSLAACLLTNYYMGYMVCVFSVLYFICRIVMLLCEKEKGIGKTVADYALASVLAGALAAVVLLPTAMALLGTKANFSTEKLSMYPMYSLRDQLNKFVCAAVPTGNVEESGILVCTPQIYCGAVTTAFMCLYFCNGNIKAHRRIIYACFLAVLFLSSAFNGTYVMWHAFNYPSGFPCRNAFLISFAMICCSWQGFSHREGLTFKNILFALLPVAAALLIINPVTNFLVSRKMILLDIFVIVLSLLLMALENKKTGLRISCAMIALLQFGSSMLNATVIAEYFNGGLEREHFNTDFMADRELFDWLEDYDGGFYRVGCGDSAINSPFNYMYSGLSHFSSTEQNSTKEFVINFGLPHQQNLWVQYDGDCPAPAEAFLGLKYVADPAPDDRGYTKIKNIGGRNVYRNPNALGIAVCADPSVLSANLDVKDTFDWQNRVFSAVYGDDAKIFIPQKDISLETENAVITANKNGADYYRESEYGQKMKFTYRFKISSDKPLYINTAYPLNEEIPADNISDLTVNGEKKDTYLGRHSKAVCLGCFHPGDTVCVEVEPRYFCYTQYGTYFYYEDEGALSACCDAINAKSKDFRLERISDSHIYWSGDIKDDDSVLMFTIPADKGWRVKADGKNAEILTALGRLIAVDVGPGQHEVELQFTPPGLYAGTAVSLVSAALLIVLTVRQRKKQKNKDTASVEN